MAVIEVSKVINNSAAEIYDFVENHPERLSEWFEGIRHVNADENFPEVGSQMHFDYHAMGIDMKTVSTVLEHNPGVKFSAQMDGVASGVQTWTFEEGDSGTLVTIHFDYDMAGGGLGKIADKLMVERQNTKNFEQSLENLKSIMER